MREVGDLLIISSVTNLILTLDLSRVVSFVGLIYYPRRFLKRTQIRDELSIIISVLIRP